MLFTRSIFLCMLFSFRFFPPTILIFYFLTNLAFSTFVSTHLVTCANERGSRDTLVHSKLVFLRVILRDWTIIRKMPVHAMFQSLAFV